MRSNRIGMWIGVCSLAVGSLAVASLACDKEKTVAAAAKCGSKETTVKQVADARSECTKGTQAATLAVAATDAPACQKSAAEHRAMQLMVQALTEMQGCCPDCPVRTHLVAAVRSMAEAKPELACGTVTKLLACDAQKATGATTAQVAAVSTDGSKCCASANRVQAVAAGTKQCDPSACTKGVKGTAAEAKFVAFGCEKTDRIARAAARAYLSFMCELKCATGAQGCPQQAASLVLASVLQEMGAEQAQAQTEETAAVADVETVSFGAVSEKPAEKPATCGSKP